MSIPARNPVLAHWYHLIDGFQTSSLEFYTAVEQLLGSRTVPGVKVGRVLHSEAGVMTADREYLRVKRGPLVFDICAAPFGTGFFFSWWLVKRSWVWRVWAVASVFLVGWAGYLVWKQGFLRGVLSGSIVLLFSLLSFVIALRKRFFDSVTYYQMDTALMFQEAVRQSVMEVIDQLTAAKGVRALTDLERQPRMSALGR